MRSVPLKFFDSPSRKGQIFIAEASGGEPRVVGRFPAKSSYKQRPPRKAVKGDAYVAGVYPPESDLTSLTMPATTMPTPKPIAAAIMTVAGRLIMSPELDPNTPATAPMIVVAIRIELVVDMLSSFLCARST